MYLKKIIFPWTYTYIPNIASICHKLLLRPFNKFHLIFLLRTVSDKKSLMVTPPPPPHFLRRITVNFMNEKYLSVLGSVGFHMSPEPCVFESTESQCNKRSRSKTPKSGKRPSDNSLSCLAIAECNEISVCHFSADDSKLYRIHPPSFVNKRS